MNEEEFRKALIKAKALDCLEKLIGVDGTMALSPPAVKTDKWVLFGDGENPDFEGETLLSVIQQAQKEP
jgi:hypothetical protein